jgi:hypothetical protein
MSAREVRRHIREHHPSSEEHHPSSLGHEKIRRKRL